jgi:long-subunit fatty acid transport protein
MNYKKILILIALLAMFLLKCSAIASNYGTSGAQILNMHTSAKITSLANAGVSYADDVNALSYNPAGLSEVKTHQIQASHNIYFLGSKISSLSFAINIFDIGVGFKWKYFSDYDRYVTATNVGIEKFDIKYIQYTLGAGMNIYRQSFGVNVNYFEEQVYEEKGNSVSLDAGWRYDFSRRKHMSILGVRHGIVSHFEKKGAKIQTNVLGAAVKNIGADIKTGSSSFRLPLQLALGGTHEFFENILLLWEGSTGLENYIAGKLAVEAEVEGYKFRAGAEYTTQINLTFGFGIPENNWYVDYSFFPHRDLGIVHRVSVGIKFEDLDVF